MPLSDLLSALKAPVKNAAVAASPSGFKLFFSVCEPEKRAVVMTAEGDTFDDAWDQGVRNLHQRAEQEKIIPQWLKVDWIEEVKPYTWSSLREELNRHKRNYYRFGLALDEQLEYSFLEQELNANATLYLGGDIPHADLNQKNFTRFARQRYGDQVPLDFSSSAYVYRLRHKGIFCAEGEEPQPLYGVGRNAGRRVLESLDEDTVCRMIHTSSGYLGRQVQKNGRFDYGWHPCFDRSINTYNTLRHASSTYAMLEGWEVTREPDLLAAIKRSLCYLNETFIKTACLDSGQKAAFLTDLNDEIKLGGNAVCLLAFTKYSELVDDAQYLPLLEQLALGIRYMQNQETGHFVHVLNYPELSVKETFRTIYYAGEAAFGLMRLYGLKQDERWLTVVEKAFDHFIKEDYWQAHDHWLSYCVNELTLYRPEERYYRFGINNVVDHLDFVINRITTFPTLLELMMAAHKMLGRIQQRPELQHLIEGIDLDKFHHALQSRAHYLMNGYFWPEYAMYFEKPAKIVGSFYIRHHSFRVRIDDVEHYLSGYVSYLKDYLQGYGSANETRGQMALSDVKHTAKAVDKYRYDEGPNWNAARLLQATKGQWFNKPGPRWRATGLCIHAPTFQPGQMITLQPEGDKRFIAAGKISDLPFYPQALITQDTLAEGVAELGLPVLKVNSLDNAILNIGRYARSQIQGKVIGVTGSSGKTTTVAMLSRVLAPYGTVAQTAGNANLPRGIAWNIASVPWSSDFVILEMAIGGMSQNAEMVKPDIAVFTNVAPAHLKYHKTTEEIARKKSRIFSHMTPGSYAVINRDMSEWGIAEQAALHKGLKIISYGEHQASDIQLKEIHSDTGDVMADIYGTPITFTLSVPGKHMALNALACLAVVHSLKLTDTPAKAMLNLFEAVAGRGQLHELTVSGHDIKVINDAYNANPASVLAALQSFRVQKSQGRKVLVLGDMLELGDHAENYHQSLISDIEKAGADHIFLIGKCMVALLPALKEKGISCSSYEDLNNLKTSIESYAAADDLFMFKASNGVGLQYVIRQLQESAA